jgi:hypothetical protein
MAAKRTPFEEKAGGLEKSRLWLALAPDERLWVAAILAIVLVGLTVRWWHQRNQVPQPYDPPSASAPTESAPLPPR